MTLSRQTQELDIDRLHDTLRSIREGEYRQRAVGTTTALLYLMLGEAHLAPPDSTYLYVGNTWQHSMQVLDDFAHILWEHTDEQIWSENSMIRVGEVGPSFRFTSISMAGSPMFLGGFRFHKVFLDVDESVLKNLENAGELHRILTNINYRLHPFGEIV